ncbi:uncharacterized protein, putative amidase [Opitutaceae bacterium TAV1]|nr:uncharacterized protein, putative amidase [Opitutaceae bacterium TAV1]
MPINQSAGPFPSLCIADDATFWPWHPWTDFARWPDPGSVTVVLPVAGMADWDLGWPLDAEETLSLGILRAAAARPALPEGRLLVLPPLRFVLGPSASCAFPVDPPLAHAALAEGCSGVAAAGFRRIVLYNASPWNEELVDAAARDLRIDHGWQMFCINLSALGLDLAPWRRSETTRLLALWQELHDPAGGGPVLEAAADSLVELLREIAARPPLPANGAIRPMTA